MKKVGKYLIFLLILFLILLFTFIFIGRTKPNKVEWGVAFSSKHADQLGLDWKETYLAILNDLGVKNIRIITHWDLIEPENNKYEFEYLDWQIKKAKKKDAKVILNIGMKTARWPECHLPGWIRGEEKKEQQKEVKELLNKILSLVNKQGEISTYLIDKLKLEKEFSNHTTIIEKKKIYSIDNIKNEKVVIAIGIGIKNRKNLKAIEDFAKNNNLIIVGTRQAAMNNFIPLENMVGVSNKQIKPNLLICIGLSGAPAFFEGVKKSKKIISINNDINAPIMENSDIKINEDVEKIFN